MIDVAPGNKADRESVYMEVIAKKECEPKDIHDRLHKWRFNFSRLTRLGTKAPDPSLQFDALTAMSKKWAALDFAFAYRLPSILGYDKLVWIGDSGASGSFADVLGG